jgi:hypothetical protein
MLQQPSTPEIELLDCEQGSPEWDAARLGLPTASQFHTILAGSAGRQSYLWQLAGERLTGEPSETYSNEDMERGKRMEPMIRSDYQFRRGVEVTRVGFIRNGKCGASTDGLVGDDGIVEFKSAKPSVLAPLLPEKGRGVTFPKRFYPQCQGGLMVSGRQWCDLMVFWHPKMPFLLVRTERDEAYIAKLRDAIDVFDLELRRLVKYWSEI